MRKLRLFSILFVLVALLLILRSDMPVHVEWPTAPEVYRDGRPRQRLALNTSAAGKSFVTAPVVG
jgi:hypothetical protein